VAAMWRGGVEKERRKEEISVVVPECP